MKKLFYSVMAFAALFVSCSKENQVVNNEEPVMIPKSFTVVSPETKTALDGVSIKWSANDEICVIAATTGNKYTFTIDAADAGKASATFNGSINAADEAETTFYAVYPNQAIRSVSNGIIEFDKRLNSENAVQAAVAGGFNPAYSIMVATSDASGTFAFSHRSAFLKLTVGNDHVSSINIKSSSTRFYGRPKVPIADADMAYNSGKYSIEGAVDNVTLGGTLVNGTTYYIPVPIKNSKLGTITLTYTFDNGTSDKQISTTTWTNNYLSAGKIYNLGAPVLSINPEITASNVNIDAAATSGSIDFSIVNTVSGGEVYASVVSGGDLAVDEPLSVTYNNATGIGTVSFTCPANTDPDNAKTVYIKLDYKDDPSASELATKEVKITQAASGATGPETHKYVFYLNSSGSVVQTADGDPGSFFTVSGSSTLLCATSGSKPYFGVDNYTIEGIVINYAKKIDSSNNVSFTTRTGYTSTIKFYCASRNTNTTATMKFKGENYSLTWTDNKADLICSGVVDLDEGTSYSFSKSGEVGLFYVEVNETSNP